MPAFQVQDAITAVELGARDEGVAVADRENVISPSALRFGGVDLPNLVEAEQVGDHLAIPHELIERGDEGDVRLDRRVIEEGKKRGNRVGFHAFDIHRNDLASIDEGGDRIAFVIHQNLIRPDFRSTSRSQNAHRSVALKYEFALRIGFREDGLDSEFVRHDTLGEVVNVLAAFASGGHDFAGVPQSAEDLLGDTWAEPGTFPFVAALLELTVLGHQWTAVSDLFKDDFDRVFVVLEDALLEPFSVDIVNESTDRPSFERHQGGHFVPAIVHGAGIVGMLLPIADLVAGQTGLENEVMVASDGSYRVELDAAEAIEDLSRRRGRREVVSHERATYVGFGEFGGRRHDVNHTAVRTQLSDV